MGAERLIFMNQVHGKKVLTLHQGHSEGLREVAHVDAIITDRPDLAIMVKQADCQAVILFDPTRGVMSNVHCGWKGNAYNILGSVVRRMTSEFGCRQSNLMAAIGPSLGPCCAEFITHEQIFPEKFRQFMVRENFFDLWKISRWQLLEAGLNEKNLEVAGICTVCRTDMFYSYRAEGLTGRFATVAMLK
jgi:YfiH family protein